MKRGLVTVLICIAAGFASCGQAKDSYARADLMRHAMDVVTHPAGGFGNMSPFDLQVTYRLSNLLWMRDGTEYKFEPADAAAWRGLMRDHSASFYGRLCAAYFLLNTDEEAQRFISTEVRSADLRHRYNAAQIVLLHFEANKDFAWDADLMISLLADGSLDGSGVTSSPGGDFPEGDRDDIMETPLDMYCWRLGQHKVVRAVDALISVVQRGVRAEGAPAALGDLGDPKAIPILLERLHSMRDGRTATALGRMKCLEAAPLIAETLLEGRTVGVMAKGEFVEALRDIGDSSVVPLLEKYEASEKHPNDKAAARRVLTELKQRDPVPGLLDLLHSEIYEPERSRIIRDLSRYPDDRVVREFTALSRTSDSAFMRREAMWGLWQCGLQGSCLEMASLLKYEFPSHLKAEWGWKGTPKDFNEEFHRYLHSYLTEATQQDFGQDADQWTRWIQDHPEAFHKAASR